MDSQLDTSPVIPVRKHVPQRFIILVGLLVVVAIGALFFFVSAPKTEDVTQTNTVATLKKIGIPIITGPVDADVLRGFKDQMTALGYVEGVNVTYDIQQIPRGPLSVPQVTEVIKHMVANNYDLLVVSRDEVHPALVETEATGKQIPLIFTRGDIALRKDIQDFRSSGKNVTGIFVPLDEIAGKQLEFVKRLKPEAKTVGFLGQGFLAPGDEALGTLFVSAIRQTAPKLGITLKEYTTDVKPGPDFAKEVERVTTGIQEGEIDAWIHVPGHIVSDQQNYEGTMGRRLKIPTMVTGFLEIQDEVGMLSSYSADFVVTGEQAAIMADKIFKGTHPEDIPIEFPKKMELSFNLKTAAAIGLTVPDTLISVADKFVK